MENIKLQKDEFKEDGFSNFFSMSSVQSEVLLQKFAAAICYHRTHFSCRKIVYYIEFHTTFFVLKYDDMSNKHITYIKPKEPSFLRALKEQIGYKKGPTVETKPEYSDPSEDKIFEGNEEEQPVVVVLKSGDLASEEVAREKEEFKRESESALADLTIPILFKKPDKPEIIENTATSRKRFSVDNSVKQTKKVKNNRLLSFDDEQLDEN